MGHVATSEIQAARAGTEVLAAGGTAVDACITMAAALTVTEPTSNGLGGDLFALVGHGSKVHALAANGRSPRALPVEAIRRAGLPLHGWPTVTVPGQISGWEALHRRFGRVPFAELLAPAIDLAATGFTLGPVTAAAWARAARAYRDSPSWCDTFLPGGAPPEARATVRLPDHAETLRLIAREGAPAFYGLLADRLVRFAEATGGWFTPADFAESPARWVTPLDVPFAGWQVYGMTAPTQGVAALQALGVLEGPDPGTPEHVHRAIEAVKLAFADTRANVADPDHMAVPPSLLLDRDHLARQRARLGRRAGPSPAAPGISGGTVLLCAADDSGQVASVIQSNFHGFGSGLVVPGTGIALQNRGAGFTLEPGHPNELAGAKRPFHTILPGLVRTPHGLAPFGCMGGQMQPQGHVQMVTALARGTSPAQTVGDPRWRWLDAAIGDESAPGDVALEVGFSEAVAAALEERGHAVTRDVAPRHFGGAQLLWPTAAGMIGASDPRKDGAALAA